MKANKIKRILAYNLKAYGPPKLVNAEKLDESKFRFNTDDIAKTATSYFYADPDVWEFPAKNYFVRICIAYALADNGNEFFKLLDDNSILPYDDRYSKPYSKDKSTYQRILHNTINHMEEYHGYKKTMEIFGYLYEHPLHGRKLSAGYNLTGQDFFDILHPYKKYFEEFFFSFTHTMPKHPLNYDEIYKQLKDCEQYGIPANLLLNTEADEDMWEKEVADAMRCTELKSVSVLDIKTARAIKARYPELRIHISTHGAQNISLEDLDPDLIYAFNVNEPSWYEEKPLVERCHQLGIKVKYIVNRGCVFGKHDMMSEVAGRFIMCCQGYQCKQLMKTHPWIILTRTNLYKEQIMGVGADILKLSTRELNNKNLTQMLRYWTSCQPSIRLTNDICLTDGNYQIFLDWIKTKENCSGRCAECRKCKEFYQKILEAE